LRTPPAKAPDLGPEPSLLHPSGLNSAHRAKPRPGLRFAPAGLRGKRGAGGGSAAAGRRKVHSAPFLSAHACNHLGVRARHSAAPALSRPSEHPQALLIGHAARSLSSGGMPISSFRLSAQIAVLQRDKGGRASRTTSLVGLRLATESGPRNSRKQRQILADLIDVAEVKRGGWSRDAAAGP
jgi:hypothetical protein